MSRGNVRNPLFFSVKEAQEGCNGFGQPLLCFVTGETRILRFHPHTSAHGEGLMEGKKPEVLAVDFWEPWDPPVGVKRER